MERIQIEPLSRMAGTTLSDTKVCRLPYGMVKTKVKVDDRELGLLEIEAMAINDGFDSLQDFLLFFEGGFKGKIIHWTRFRY
ncbi:hypothetical protein AGMMS49574_28830 [Bacteroidia bacterium]|nr:hypothetical protein AGMMS49574_28830 [Bacteroidia bacterium]